jgi:L-asparaginase II
VAPEKLLVAVDGCSVSVFGLPLRAMAEAYARLATAPRDGTPRERALARIRDAMARFPRLVGGEGRFGTLLTEGTAGRCVAKGGAEGLECVALPERGLGVALKCEDGQARGVGAATLAVLERLGALNDGERERLAAARRPIVRNAAGLEVGSLEAVVREAHAVA